MLTEVSTPAVAWRVGLAMTREKIIITWEDVNSPAVDARLREQEARHREDAYTSPALTMGARQLRTQQRASIWYDTVFAMAFFGLLGGLLAWGAGELIQLKPLARVQYLAQLAEAQDQWEAVQSIQRRYAAGIERDTAAMQIRTVQDAARENPYFQILRNSDLTREQQLAEIDRQHSFYDAQGFIAKVLAYGLIGMIIALGLAVADPLIDRNWQGVAINGAVGAMLGLFGGVIVSLFVDRLHGWLGGTEAAELATGLQLVANAIKYGVVGLFLTIAPGVLMRSGKKLGVGLAGGVIGGVIGGVLFAPVAQWTGSVVLSRLIATGTIGLVAGVATGLIENAAKTGWLRVIQGLIAGKQFILYRATTYIGSSPDCHVYLFKDPGVGRRHAAVHVVPGGFDLEDLPLGGPTVVNGRRVTRHRLRTGDQIQIGRTGFTFQAKVKK